MSFQYVSPFGLDEVRVRVPGRAFKDGRLCKREFVVLLSLSFVEKRRNSKQFSDVVKERLPHGWRLDDDAWLEEERFRAVVNPTCLPDKVYDALMVLKGLSV